jgi:phosphatidylserine decarboxylase
MGFWTPFRLWASSRHLLRLRDHVAGKKAAGTLNRMSPTVLEFKDWISSNSVYRMWVNSMIDQANGVVAKLDEATRNQIKDVDGDIVWIKDFDSVFDIINECITTSPSFNSTIQVGTPLYGLFLVSMATPAGIALFHDTEFNRRCKEILDAWGAYLKSPASLDKLDISDPEKDGSWISKAAWKAGVWDEMEHDPKKPASGYDSWNSFFIRQYVPGARPFKGDARTQVNVGCETGPWTYENNVPLKADFWIKDVNYSLVDLLGGREDLAKLFEGGQIYQGYLSATHYHRWRAPLDGTVERAWVEPGTYFAQRPGQPEGVGTWDGMETQPYLGHVAARAIFILKHETCGYVALICIGMGEVSTCFIEPQFVVDGHNAKPVKITRGTEIGRFEFGGSTHVMIFQRGRVKLEDWAVNAVKHQNDPKPVPMGSVIATAIGR